MSVDYLYISTYIFYHTIALAKGLIYWSLDQQLIKINTVL
jgi:hypothetical protein